jgi:hypothetical protein
MGEALEVRACLCACAPRAHWGAEKFWATYARATHQVVVHFQCVAALEPCRVRIGVAL